MNIDIVFSVILHYIYKKFAVKEAGQMKNIITVLLALVFTIINAGTISLDKMEQDEKRVLEINDNFFEAEFNLSDLNFSVVTTEAGDFTEISFKGSNFSTETGYPKLPVFRDLFMFPEGSEPLAEVISSKEKEIFLDDYKITSKIIPAQPSYSKSSLSEERKFVINHEAYEVTGYAKKEIANISISGTMRGVSVGVLEINPVTYDPSRNSLKIYTEITVKVSYSGIRSDIAKTRSEHFSPYFESAFSGFLNYTPMGTKSDLTSYPVTYLIAANEILQNNAKLEEFIAWKTRKGFNVITQFFPSSATTSTVDTWVEEQYQNLEPKPSFLLIVGDQSGTYVLPSEQNPPLGSAGSVTVSDLLYGVIGATSSTNRIPSIYVGRFSVNEISELDAQIDKTIWYEKGQFESETADLSYLSNVMGVAGVDASYSRSHGDPHISYGMTYYFDGDYRIPLDGSRAEISPIQYLSNTSNLFTTDAEVVSHVSEGVAFYNYTAHGYNGGFADPTFTISNVNSLTNQGKYPLVIGNCCLTGSFRDTECFGESWLNAADKGGIGFIGASMSTYWDEDLAMGVGLAASNQFPPPLDTTNPGMYDGNMRMNYPSQAGVKHVGLLAVERLGTGMTSSYWSSYHLFGDPSLMVYMGIPGENTVSHDPFMTPGETFFTVQALKNSYVSITGDDGTLHGAAISDETGIAVIPIQPFTAGNAHITVTSQFKKPYFASVPVENITGPYLTLNDHQLTSLSYASDGTIDIELKNIGVLPSEGITAIVSSESEFISFSDSAENFGTIADGDSSKVISAFSYSISPNVPDGENIRVDLTVTDSSKRTYENYISLKAKAPVLTVTESLPPTITDPSDTVPVSFLIDNIGHADIHNLKAVLTEINGLDIYISDPVEITDILSGGSFSADFRFAWNSGSNLSLVSSAEFVITLTGDSGFSSSDSLTVLLGITDGFETGDLSHNSWILSGNSDWTADDLFFYQGNYSARSGDIADSEQSRMSLNYNFSENASVSFYLKTSSEANYDILSFYIDDILKSKWSGELNWRKVSYEIPEGNHSLHWHYEKDSSVSTGLDCGWIDNVIIGGILEEKEITDRSADELKLIGNYPNPFNPVTDIKYYLNSEKKVELSVYNISGQLVKELVNEKLNAGMHTAIFNAAGLNSGMYFYVLKAGNTKLSKKMILIK